MTDERPMKRSESLALDNVKRIASQLRSERNEALAAAQEHFERARRLAERLREARAALGRLGADADLLSRIDEALD